MTTLKTPKRTAKGKENIKEISDTLDRVKEALVKKGVVYSEDMPSIPGAEMNGVDAETSVCHGWNPLPLIERLYMVGPFAIFTSLHIHSVNWTRVLKNHIHLGKGDGSQ